MQIKFNASWLEHKLNPEAVGFNHYVEYELKRAKFSEDIPLSQQISNVMDHTLSETEPCFRGYASAFNMSTRSFQRHLKIEGTSFKAITEAVRRKIASEYICNYKYTVDEIAFLLGYSEVRPFYRAFKRWYSQSPREYRLQLAL